ncbi:hypothetical protein [Pseudoalteromonas luteoviolacea]|uniref:Uncharacterized protein n=1 Tax=Pseudoalteromonas luteoviolacea DSM 6061 TaxID=1365250 RepID=A0A166YRG1_9GAMM|nr:hypothetical protein [Pseudoalteromonas luteoviolacea]KZN43296.1 hypothetical protein N475_09340 [Pseudoalteromonas luteoviolacea DSM 6061]MBE0385435.1 hypothetical protein [Pseudoalteromonas luteoviolacea DSM 6061]
MEELLGSLSKFVIEHNIESRAHEGARQWAESEDFEIDNSITKKSEFNFSAHKLCFKDENRSIVYIETYLNIMLDDEETGYYCWVSS